MQITKHHGAELELDLPRYAELMKFVAQNVSQSMVVFPHVLVITRALSTSCSLSVVAFGDSARTALQ